MIKVRVSGDDGMGFIDNFSDEFVLDDIDRVMARIKENVMRVSKRQESLPKYEIEIKENNDGF